MTAHKHTNRLAEESSPYLLQHAHNPVDWYPWGPEALEKARAEHKPMLLSIGYSACHWCHVMERESFEDEATAQLMNTHFVNIKVDREERPDLDQIYMNAVQMMTGHGGWPMTMFLTPDGVPFYGGTYFPPVDRYNMPGFKRVLLGVAQAFHQRPSEVEETVRSLTAAIAKNFETVEAGEVIDTQLLETAFESISRSYDPIRGGFGGAPKFPAPMTLEFLLRHHLRTGKADALKMVENTSRQMAMGGMYDQIGGGFHRYSTDANWRIPHFEKMLYDNAQLARLYVHLFQLTSDSFYRDIAVGTLDYVLREMTDPRGGFYSAQDADSEGEEGKYFVWDKDEIEAVLEERADELICSIFNVTGAPDFEGKYILHLTDESLKKIGALSSDDRNLFEEAKRRLFDVRGKRVKPATDDKVLTAWSALMITAFAEASAVFQREDYAATASRAADFLLSTHLSNGRILRTSRNGNAHLNGYLEDYAFLSQALITLFETGHGSKYFALAQELVETMVEEFWDNENGGFFFTANSHERLIVRNKDYLDNATPSGNGVAAEVLVKLARLTGKNEYVEKALTVFRAVSGTLRRYPSAFAQTLLTVEFLQARPNEIVLIEGQDLRLPELLHTVWEFYLPFKTVAPLHANEEIPLENPLFQGKSAIAGETTVFVCHDYACEAPVTDADSLEVSLRSL